MGKGGSQNASSNTTVCPLGDCMDQGEHFTTINAEFKVRNICVGVAGFLFNTLAFFVMVKSNKVTGGRKLLLLNLIVSDMILMTSYIVYGIDASTHFSQSKNCVVIVIQLMSSILLSYLIALHISVFNFLAVYKAFQFKTLATWKNTFIILVIIWLFTVISCCLAVGFEFPPGRTCAPVVMIERNALAFLCGIMTLAFLGVISLNIYICFKIKKNRQVLFAVSGSNAKRCNQVRSISSRTTTDSNAKTKTISKFTRVLHKNRVGPTAHGKQTDVSSSSSQHIYYLPSNESNTLQIPETSCSTGKLQVCELVPRANTPDISRRLREGRGHNHTCILVNTHLAQHISGGGSPAAVHPTHPITMRREPSMLPRTFLTIDKLRKTFIVLTTYTCLLTLPMVIYCFLIVSRVIEDPEKVVAMPIGIAFSCLPSIRATVNPIFYVLKFVKWPELINKTKQSCLCCKRGQ